MVGRYSYWKMRYVSLAPPPSTPPPKPPLKGWRGTNTNFQNYHIWRRTPRTATRGVRFHLTKIHLITTTRTTRRWTGTCPSRARASWRRAPRPRTPSTAPCSANRRQGTVAMNCSLISTGPLARGHLIWPLGHLVWHSTGLNLPPKFKDQF